MPPSVPASVPLHSHSVSQASFSSCLTRLITHLDIILRHVYTTPMCHTLGCLSRMIKWLSMSTQYADHGERSFSNYFTNSATICRRSPLASLNHSNQCCRLIEILPHILAFTERRHVTSIHVSSFRSTWTSSVFWPGYASIIMNKGSRAS